MYLRTEHSIEEVEVNLMASKTRVALIKKQTMSRLELLGANLLALGMNDPIDEMLFKEICGTYLYELLLIENTFGRD